jgi:starch phosphorylase
MWKDVEGRSEIIGITNAVHKGTWAYNKIIRAFEQNEDLWAAHMDTKKEMVAFIEKRTGRSLNAENLIIGFSRRATGYKRNNLIFREEERIKGLLEEGKLQIVFSGKAHPRDCGGKDMILSIAEMEKKYPGSVVFIENYDMEVGSMLTRGCDVWLNNPRRPKEASGTSGMKAAMNGVLNCSILDGWWPEVCKHGVNGWAIGDEVVPDSEEEQDKKDLKALYRVLLEEVVPTYYNDRPKWVEMMRKSISSTIETFSMERMLKQYYELLYSVK